MTQCWLNICNTVQQQHINDLLVWHDRSDRLSKNQANVVEQCWSLSSVLSRLHKLRKLTDQFVVTISAGSDILALYPTGSFECTFLKSQFDGLCNKYKTVANGPRDALHFAHCAAHSVTYYKYYKQLFIYNVNGDGYKIAKIIKKVILPTITSPESQGDAQ